MFLEVVLLSTCFTQAMSHCLASPLPPQPYDKAAGQVATLKEILENLQTTQYDQSRAQHDFEHFQLHNSIHRPGYYGPAEGDHFRPAFSANQHQNFGFRPKYDGVDRRPSFKPGDGSNRNLDPFNIQGVDNGNGLKFREGNKSTRQKSESGSGYRGSGSVADPISGSGTANRVGSEKLDEGRELNGNSWTSGGQAFGNVGENASGNQNQRDNGGQRWTTVRSLLNRILSESTVPEAECILKCPSVNYYDPICGSDNITYTNRRKFQCARECGRVVNEVHRGSCVTTTVP